jgi:5-methylcytosine-specific restriction endonuclease McrA
MSRREQLSREPLCAKCGQVADTVHHRKPIEDGGAKRDPNNLMSLCSACHSALHRVMAARRQLHPT